MELWTSLLSLCTVLGAFLIVQCSGQVCDTTLRVSSFSENPIEDDVMTCIECVIRGTVSTTATWLIGTTPGGSATTPISSSDGEVENGVLVIFDPSTIIPGLGNTNAIRVACSAGGTSVNFFIILDAFLPPEVSNVTVNETNELVLNCADNNAAGTTSVQWENSEGEVLVKSISFRVDNVQRNYTGVYTCVLTRNDNNETLSADANVIVQYAPEVSTQEEGVQLAPLGGELALSCDFDGVPTPTVEWLHNNVPLSDSDPNVTITTDANSSLLELTNLQRDSNGQYVCRGTNVVGDDSIMVGITIMVPPSPATNLRVVNVNEFNITLAWSNDFDGFSPVTGVQIEIFEGDQLVDTRDLSGSSSLETTVVSSLSSFTDYTFLLRVRNAIGLSVPVNVSSSTLSLVLVAPTITRFIAVDSTQLDLVWMAPDSVDTTDDPDNWTVLYTRQGSSNPVVLTVFSTSVMISDLDKGTSYTATVTGNNVRGPGTISEPITAQTLVDPPTAPEGLSVVGVAATALEIIWMPPSDNGGRPIDRYQLSISENGSVFVPISLSIGSDDRSYLFRSSSELFELEENTTYWVRLAAVNSEPLVGAEATQTGTTQSILQPQRIFDIPAAPDVSNITSFVSWLHPGGDVSNFIIEYKLRRETWTNRANVFTVSVTGDRLNTTIEGLEPAFTYDLRILVNNSLGMSVFSPVLSFTTALPSTPDITSSSNMTKVSSGQTVVLMCVTDVSPDRIVWIKDGDEIVLREQNTLTLPDVQPSNSGMYVCEIVGTGVTSASFNLMVPEIATTLPPPTDMGGVSTTVIIAVCVVGGLALAIFTAVVLFAVVYLCCCKKKSGYSPKKRNRSMTWMETSAQYVQAPKNGASGPSGPSGSNNKKLSDTNQPSFDIPEDFTTHSSFNTLEKQNKVRRSPSPQAVVQYTEVSSFQHPHSGPIEIHGQGDSVQYSAVAPSYEDGSPTFEYIPQAGPQPAPETTFQEPPTHSNTTV